MKSQLGLAVSKQNRIFSTYFKKKKKRNIFFSQTNSVRIILNLSATEYVEDKLDHRRAVLIFTLICWWIKPTHITADCPKRQSCFFFPAEFLTHIAWGNTPKNRSTYFVYGRSWNRRDWTAAFRGRNAVWLGFSRGSHQAEGRAARAAGSEARAKLLSRRKQDYTAERHLPARPHTTKPRA